MHIGSEYDRSTRRDEPEDPHLSRRDIGDEATGVEGANVRPIGRVPKAETLTRYDPEHPYMIAMYDLHDNG